MLQWQLSHSNSRKLNHRQVLRLLYFYVSLRLVLSTHQFWVSCYDRRSVEIKQPSGAYDQIFITVWQLRVCWCGVLSLTRGRVFRIQLLLALASAVILGSESRGTSYHILLPQIRDFPFRRLLRHAGLQWKYSNAPPHGMTPVHQLPYFIITLHGPNRRHRSPKFLYCCFRIRYRRNLFTEPLPINVRLLWLHYSGLQVSSHSISKFVYCLA
jgi:hypothetical protein